MSAVELPPLIDPRVDTVLISDEIGFNEWRAAVETCLTMESTSQWYLGDLWNFGKERFAKDYHAGLQDLQLQHSTLVEYARVARIFPPRRTHDQYARVDGISFFHHQIAASIVDPEERLGWLEDAALHRWSGRKLAEEIKSSDGDGHERLSPPTLSLRATGDVVSLFEARAAALGMPAKELALEVLGLAAQLDDPIGALEAAGARRELEAA